MSKFLVLGYFGYKTNQLDGQTVKTRDLYRLAREQYGDSVEYFDTEDFKFSKVSVVKMFWRVVTCRHLIYLPAHNNLKFIFPIVFCLSWIFRFDIHYFVVGGWLKEFLEDLPMHRRMVSKISNVYVETRQMKSSLEDYYHFENVELFLNFRYFDFDPNRVGTDKLRLVFMARINKMKGLDWIFELLRYIENNGLVDRFSMTFYGPVHEEDKAYFEENLAESSIAEYKGVLQPDEIYSTLNDYDVMLLPTHYYTEGLPGSIVDAYISGIPVIVSEWKHAHEFVDDEETGFIVPFVDGQQYMIERVMQLESDRKLLTELQKNSLQKRNQFAPPQLTIELN